MKRTLLLLVLTLFSIPALAAIQYEYTQKAVTEDVVVPTTDLVARATVDGLRTRVEFLSGNLYPPGTYVISIDGSRLFFIDPMKKWYTEFNAAGAVTAIGASNIKIENLRTDTKDLGDGPVIAGAPTHRYQLTLDYDVTLVMRQIPLKQSVHTVIDSYMTSKFGELALNVLADGVRTGNQEIDQLLELETTKMTGFPLRQTVTIRMTSQTKSTNSQLKVKPTRTFLRETVVTSVRELQPKLTDFSIPVGYTRADSGERPRTATQVLTFEPGK
ncbi:MAG TPA: hypothetical protein VKB93_29650 [Thermoanaerobaculia bacterium]|nr:hypothetical protein [Thermoanaerobaculia bacterium]